MDDRPPLNEDDRALLIAYLDGELDEEATQKVETRFSQDSTFRFEAMSLRRTWELLDFLPKVEPSATFAHRTLASLTTRLPAGSAGLIPGGWKFKATWAAAVLIAGVVGFVIVTCWLPHEPSDKELVRDLHIIENKRLYEQVGSLDYLRELDRPDLFGEDSLEGGD